MRSRFPRLVAVVCLGLGALFLTVPSAFAQKNKKPVSANEAGGGSIEKQSAWEQKVMGEDGEKAADRKKIAAAQKMAAEAKKNPPPEPAVHHKDPNKEGVNAKRESNIGLPIASEEAEKNAPKKTTAKKTTAAASPANDELGALVAASLASDKKAEAADPSSASDSGKTQGRKGKKVKPTAKTTAAKADPPPSSLDRMFAGGK